MTSLCDVFNQLLVIMESVSSTNMSYPEGFAICVTLLQQIMAVGYLQRLLMIQIGGIPRVLALFLKVSTQGNTQNLHKESPILSAILDLLVTLLRSCIIAKDRGNKGSVVTLSQGKMSPFVDKNMKDGTEAVGALLVLSQDDLSCVMNRVFLVEAVRLDSMLMSQALNHICWSRDDIDCFELLEFLAETSKECLLSNPDQDAVPPPAAAKKVFGESYFMGRDKSNDISSCGTLRF